MTTPCTHPAAEPDFNKEARGSNENASNNIGQGANQEDIAELRRQGVEVENEYCLPENLPSGENENQIPGVQEQDEHMQLPSIRLQMVAQGLGLIKSCLHRCGIRSRRQYRRYDIYTPTDPS